MFISSLENKNPCSYISSAELAAYFEVSPRTIYRDIETYLSGWYPVVSLEGLKSMPAWAEK
ncbi:MAG TPA: HTH domain-containing protein [Halanaerobiaceae bacterium]|nr:HTH domain-containing protein [Halanaerobiaceae bacterium]